MIVNLHPVHIKEVLADLSDQTRAELQASHIDEADLMPRFLRFMMSGDCAEGHAFLNGDGRALCALAIARHEGISSTFLIAAAGFFEASRHNVRSFRGYMAWMAKKFGAIYVFSRSPHPDAGKWFKLLGAVEQPKIDGFEKVYRWG